MDTFRAAVKVGLSGSGTAAALYRVRKSWGDAASQRGAFQSLPAAKALADKHPGYSVFDAAGKKVYTSYRVYTVVRGDSLLLIAQKTLGNGFRFGEIKTLNKLSSSVVCAGQKLKIPN